MLRTPGARGEDQVVSGESPAVAAYPTAGADGLDLPHPVGALLEFLDRRHRNDLCASRFGKPKVIFQQRVLGAVTAARHAATALQAAGAFRSGTAEERVGHGLAGRLGPVRT